MPPARTKPPVVDPANRTRLAWTRTAVGFAAIGAAMLKVSPIAGSIVLVLSLPIWAVARRVRGSDAISSPAALRLVMVTVVVVALAALVVALFGRSPDSLGQLLRGR